MSVARTTFARQLVRLRKASAARCLLDLLGPHDGAVAGGADSILAILRFGATLERAIGANQLLGGRRQQP